MNIKHAALLVTVSALAGLACWKWMTPAPARQTFDTLQPAVEVQQPGQAQASTPFRAADTAQASPASIGSSPMPAAGAAEQGQPGTPKARLYGSAFEASLLTDGFVNSRATKLLEAKDFGKVVENLDAQNAGERNSVSDQYRAQVENTLASFDKGQVERFACGVNVCVASIIDREPGEWFGDWYENVQSAVTMRVGALTRFDVAIAGGGIEHRILFTTHPDSAGFIVDPAPLPRR